MESAESVKKYGLFIAGSETNSSTAEWVLTELLYNPECMAKAKEELSLFTTRESMDADRIGVTTRKAVPLMATPKKCAT
ncbi:Cytochrome P450 [Dillenia turbinata]|uniref:Cytochrome P450 n=1 Tax=Dillenia turbinata TaxID=194707 RepID=A0AAN8W655_9MAGN